MSSVPHGRPGSSACRHRDQISVGKRGDRESGRSFSIMPVADLCYPQALGEASNDSEYEADKSLYSAGSFSNGNFGLNPPFSEGKGLCSVLGPQGRLSACSHSSEVQGPFGVFVSGPDLSVPVPSFRPSTSPPCVYSGGRGSSGLSQGSRSSSVLLSGRLDPSGGVRISSLGSSLPVGTDDQRARFPDKLGEVQSISFPRPFLFGSGARYPVSTGPAQPGQDFDRVFGGSSASFAQTGQGQTMAPVSGLFGQSGGFGGGLSTAHETFPGPPSQVLPSGQRFSVDLDPVAGSHQVSLTSLDRRGLFGSRQAFPGSPAVNFGIDGCLSVGLGRPLQRRYGVGGLVTSAGVASHQRAGVFGSDLCSTSLCHPVCSSVGFDFDGQCNCGGVHKPAGRHPVCSSGPVGRATMELVSSVGHYTDSFFHSRSGESDCRLPFSRSVSAIGVDAPSGSFPDAPFDLGSVGRRPVCLGVVSSAPEVLLPSSGPGGVGVGCVLPQLGDLSGIRFSSVSLDPSGVVEGQGGSSTGDFGGPQLAQASLVPGVVESARSSSVVTSATSGFSDTTPVGDSPPQSGVLALDCLASVRETARQSGLSERAADFVAGSRRDSTQVVYNSRLSVFFEWCQERDESPKTASLGSIADFLIHLFDKGRALSTIRGYRSAIGAIHTGFSDGSGVSSSPHLCGLLRSFFLKRPPVSQLVPSWSLPKVLEALGKPPFEPMGSSSLHHLTVKTVFLMAIASGQRRSTLHALCLTPGHIRWEARGGVRLIPKASFIAKNQTASSGPVEVFLCPLSDHSSIREDKVWCPVRALKWYVEKTKPFRTDDQLFLITREPFSPASRVSVSRWIVEAIRAAGPEALSAGCRPRAHDTRSISTSWALFQGVGLEDILRAAYWRSRNSFISCYLKDVPAGEVSFASAPLKAAASSL